jgi:Glycosyl hydrolase catalytic core
MKLVRACATAAVLAAFAASAPAAHALPGSFWGVVPQATPTFDQMQRLDRGGVRSIRIPVVWNFVQPSPGAAFDWSGVDEKVENAARLGIEVFPFLSGAPEWAVPSIVVPGLGGAKATRNLPVRGAAGRGWSAFVAAAVSRYGPSGSFWAERPAVPRRPIRTWQIWNEENFAYFVARPNPGEYGKLVKLSYNALRSVDRRAKLVLGGMFAAPKQAELRRRPPLAYFAADFLDELYARTPGIKSKFHGVALHPYAVNFKRLTPYIEEFRDVLEANHDAGKGLWISELGWSSEARGNAFAKGRQGQARQLRGAFALLRGKQRKWRIQRVYWFSVDDIPGACNFCGGSGLFSEGFVPKPSWISFTRFAGGRP